MIFTIQILGRMENKNLKEKIQNVALILILNRGKKKLNALDLIEKYQNTLILVNILSKTPKTCM